MLFTIMSWIIWLSFIQLAVILAKKEIPSIKSPGDIIIGGLFPVHEKGSDGQPCGAINLERGIQRLEAMRFAIKEINDDQTILKGVDLGVKILDTCSDATHALDQSLDFVMSTLTMTEIGRCTAENEEMASTAEPIMAVVGAAYSSVSIQIANLLRLFQIPQISYASTSAELSEKDRFGYFMRTVPPDTLQAKALVDIVERFNWTYVSTIASEGEYGDSGIAAFKREFLKKDGQCVATSLRITRTADENEFLDAVKSLYRIKKARVVILFVGQDDATGILKAAKSLNYENDFVWVASDGWGSAVKVVSENEEAAHGSLTITLQSSYMKLFDEYFLSLTIENNKENIWYEEYWQEYYHCKSQSQPNITSLYNISSQTAITIINNNKLCSGEERTGKFQQEAKIQFVYDAVYAIAVALDRIYRETCGNDSVQLCDEMNSSSSTRKKLLEYIKQNNRDDPYGNAIRFDENGDSLGFYNIMNYRKNPITGKYEYSIVGSWEDNHLELDEKSIVWPGVPLPGAPMSICSHECEMGWRKEMKDEYACCWSCIKCEEHEYLPDMFTCVPCGIGKWPNKNRTACYDLRLQFVEWQSPFAIVPAAMSFLGLVAAISTAMIFIKYMTTPVVKAAGRELSFMLLFGCIMCYGGIFILLIKPSTAVCIIQRFFIGIGFAIIYSALLVKTNRIYRIFDSANKTTKRPACISPKSQILIASLLAAVQLIIFVIWLILEPPGVRQDIPNPSDRAVVVLKCKYKESSVLISLSYNMLLIIVCTIYAILTRKIPSSFNESKFIGFTMYTTCIVWLSFVPIYFGLKTSFQIQITTLCTAIFLSATVALFCLFGHKVHIIVFHPDKNKRKSMAERQRFSTNLKVNKTETEYMAESPNRSRTSSVNSCSPYHNGNSRKFNYELKDPAIPEEMTSNLLVQKESSSDSVFSSNCGTSSPQQNQRLTEQKKNDTEEEENIDESDKLTINNEGSNTGEEMLPSTSPNDPLDISGLKESSMMNLNECLLQSLDLVTSGWKYIDNSSGESGTPAVTPSTCANDDSGIGISHLSDKHDSLSKVSSGDTAHDINPPSDTECKEDELPERLI